MISLALHKDTQLVLTEFQKDFIHHLNLGNLRDIVPVATSDDCWAVPNYPLWAFYDWDFFKGERTFTKAQIGQPVVEGNKIILPLDITTDSGKQIRTFIHFANIISRNGSEKIVSSSSSSVTSNPDTFKDQTEEKESSPAQNEMLQLSSDDAFWNKLSEKKDEIQAKMQEKTKDGTQESASTDNQSEEEKARKVYETRFLVTFPMELRLLRKGTCISERNSWSLYDECWLKKKGQEPQG